MTSGYFTTKARAVFARAKGDPDLSGPLAEWAEAAVSGDPRRGVLVGEDGRILAETRHTPGTASTCGGTYVTSVTPDLGEDARREIQRCEVGLAVGSLQRITGQGVIHVKYADVCQGAGRTTGARA